MKDSLLMRRAVVRKTKDEEDPASVPTRRDQTHPGTPSQQSGLHAGAHQILTSKLCALPAGAGMGGSGLLTPASILLPIISYSSWPGPSTLA
ncbi:hypothetical protein SKAU_G00125610 [Synaphobranchus kaupii]|uniref:Uncharacterized protein n=1 Tax=Synaphobranchus kaupii TaxID=118154 RepID=A0A9Q1FPD8_SYNKA|nr:hypothetical protein SKAU_G00125610 [Synaphobranchus kaupii]